MYLSVLSTSQHSIELRGAACRTPHAGGARDGNTYDHILLALGYLMAILRLRGLNSLTFVRRVGILSWVVGN